MRRKRSGFQLATVIAAVLSAGSAQAESLADAIALAYQTNPSLQNQRAQLRVVDETYVQARAGYRPQVSVSADASYQDSAGRYESGGDALLTVTQPLYTGGRTASAVTAARGDILSGRESLRQTEGTVLQNVVQVYVDVRRDQQALAIRQENVGILSRQVEESNARFDVGEITRTDVAQSEASLAAARSQLATAQAQLGNSRANYAAIVGRNPGELDPEPPLSMVPPTVEQAFSAAEQNNPNLRIALYDEQATRARIAAARAERMPSVGIRAQVGYSGLLRDVSRENYERSVSASATVSQPLFAGGQINSQVRQAIERNNSAKIQIEQARRDLLQRLSQAWNQLLASRASIVAGEEQVRAARIAFQGTQEERKVGLRTTLEVLTAQQNQRDAELSLINARHDEYVASAAVLNVMGLLEARYIAPTTPLYDPTKSFNHVKFQGFVPWEPVISGLDSLLAPRIKILPSDAGAPIATAPAAATPSPATPSQ